jgi:hypothetical protein
MADNVTFRYSNGIGSQFNVPKNVVWCSVGSSSRRLAISPTPFRRGNKNGARGIYDP